MPASHKTLKINELPFLIVGQGLAGTALAWALAERGQAVVLADGAEPSEPSSSRVAAGLIAPITGRRFVKSWGLETCWPVAQRFYGRLGEQLGARIFTERRIVKVLASQQEANDWSARTGFAENRDWMSDEVETTDWAEFLGDRTHWLGQLRGGQIDLPVLLSQTRRHFEEMGCFLSQNIDNESIELDGKIAFVNREPYRAVVFCEGSAAVSNAFFPLKNAWQLAKGEALAFEIEGFSSDQILKHQLTVAPLGNGRFWAGATFEWAFSDEKPSEKGQTELEMQLRSLIGPRFRVVERRAAVRPTTTDRRPVIGLSPEGPAVGIFNGLGTKGSLLAPHWAERFAAHLLDGEPLSAEVDVRRFF